jgi:hypothetical protein
MVWKETVLALATDWGFSKTQTSEQATFGCGFVSRLNDRCCLSYKDPGWLFTHLFMHFNDRFPKHFFFANFQCLRCGQSCTDERLVDEEDIRRWVAEGRYDILQHVECFQKDEWCANVIDIEQCGDCENTGKEIVTNSYSGRCPFVRKVRKKPCYKCRIQSTKTEECSGYLCEKSLSFAHINYHCIEELIALMSQERFVSLLQKQRD